MASIIPGYEYDIFVSYRHNDNVFDGWVTEFITKLRQELQATVKEQLSIYFDENHEDGLLEYQNVDKSLEKKLKALIFIPIISRTYCDTSKYAWKNEFIPYKKLSLEDEFGTNVLLVNNNVASRILPAKIHVLDYEDIRLLENELDGNLRSIDFIYEGFDGVNRPLRSKDDELGFRGNNALFRNQINKMANAIAELIRGLKIAQMKAKHAESNSTYKAPVRMPQTSASQRNEFPFTPSQPRTSQPSAPTPSPQQNNKPSIYLAWTSSDIKAKREELSLILQKAGMNVLPYMDCPADEGIFKQKVDENISHSNCSVHILSGEFGRRFERDENVSFPMLQFEKAKEHLANGNKDYKIFIWYCPDSNPIKSQQQTFINDIRNGISPNMMFTNVPGSMQLVDDIRSVLTVKEKPVFETSDTDIFFISNQLDENDAQLITNQLSQDFPIETMTIIQDKQEHYRDKSAEQIKHSRLAVVYFKEAADWAIPFVKQVWKMIGGATSKTPILLIGEDDPETNMYRTFKAPKVISSVVSNSNIVTEIKNIFNKIGAAS